MTPLRQLAALRREVLRRKAYYAKWRDKVKRSDDHVQYIAYSQMHAVCVLTLEDMKRFAKKGARRG